MKYSLGISNFLEEVSSLSHSVVFLYFFALIAEGGFLISSCYSLELCIQMLIYLSFYISPHLKINFKMYPKYRNVKMGKKKKKYVLELVQYGICFLGTGIVRVLVCVLILIFTNYMSLCKLLNLP